MSDFIDDGEPAFPRPYSECDNPRGADIYTAQSGMSLRDYIAARVIQGMMSAPDATVDISGERLGIKRAKTAYAIADAMIKARGIE